MTSRLLDLIVTAWIVLLALVYYGGFFAPVIDSFLLPSARIAYALMLVLTVVVLVLRRGDQSTPEKSSKLG